VKFRARLTRRINRSVAWRIDDHIVDLRSQVDDLRHLLGRVEESTRELADRGADLDKRLGELDRRLDGVQEESAWSANELARLAPQVAALETRVEQKARPTVLAGELQDLPEARSLVEVVREEHARVRARLSLVSAYEERLRRLEEQARNTP
jgi:archaellum component FlaC